MSNIAFIPVRCGSKSIPMKNIKPFHGKPLIYWTVAALEKASRVHKIVVATDCEEIEQCVKQFNFTKVEVYRRSSENAQDTSSTESVMLEYIQQSELQQEDHFILVQATSPFTQAEHFDEALEQLAHSNADSLLSCVEFKRFLWQPNGEALNYDFKNRPRRQDFEGLMLENGAFYINKVGNIKEQGNRLSGAITIYEMPYYTALELDEPEDWLIGEALMAYKHKNHSVEKKQKIKLFASDVDGVLTDAGMYYSESGDELKKFNTHDGKAFQLMREAGIKTAIITSENTKMVERRAKKLKVDYLFQGKAHGGKLTAIQQICEAENIALHEVAYIGDDINCKEALAKVGLAACPDNALPTVKTIPNIIQLSKKGGEGVVREFYELHIK
ncbi:MAG: HAD family hydrolase [Bacteroidota bacterium]